MAGADLMGSTPLFFVERKVDLQRRSSFCEGFENVIETKSLKFAIPLSNDYFCIQNESEKSSHE